MLLRAFFAIIFTEAHAVIAEFGDCISVVWHHADIN